MKRVLTFSLLLLGIFISFSESWAQVPGLPNRWNNVSMPNIDTGLVGPSSFTVGGKTYMVGGDTSGYFGVYPRTTRQVWVYTHATNSWSKTTPFPGQSRMGAVAFGSTSTGKGYYGLGYSSNGYQDTAFRNKFYSAGGVSGFYDTIVFWHVDFFKDIWEFDTSTTAWTRKRNFPIYDFLLADTIPGPFLSNGIANASGFSIDTVVTFNGTPRNFAGGFIFGEYMNMHWDSLGGSATPPGYGDTRWDGAIYQLFLDRPFFYDAVNDTFYGGPSIPGIAPDPPRGRSNAVAMILDGKQSVPGRNPKLYAGLGDDDSYNPTLLNIHLKDWYSYDFGANTWKIERSLPDTGKSNAGSFAYEHIGFVTCGYDGEWQKNFFLYNTEDEDWTRYPDYRDSGRSLGAGFIHGNRGYYGAGFRGNSEELETFSWYTIDSNSIRLQTSFGPDPEFCAGSEITFDWSSGISFNLGAKMVVQISDKDGIFEWPMSDISNMDTFDIIGKTGTITAKIPHKIPKGIDYKIRIISTSPFYISRFTDVFSVLENPKFAYTPKLHPFIDTVCIHSDFFIPSKVTGSLDSGQTFTYSWLKNNQVIGAPTGIKDTLKITQINYPEAGDYRLVAQGACFADTSLEFHIFVDSVPPPYFTDNLNYPGTVGSVLTLCEYDTTTFYVVGSGKNISYQWYHNRIPVSNRDNLEGLGSPIVIGHAWNLVDSGVYTVRLVEACGSYTESDSIMVKMNAIPRIVTDPKNIEPAVLEGSTVQFAVTASGYALNYQWRKDSSLLTNGPRISGALTNTLVISNLISSDVAFYSCIVTGGCPRFADTSNLAIMDLNASPTIIKEPADTLEICEGMSNVMTIVAKGTNLRYTWQYATPPIGLDTNYFKGTKTRVLEVINAQLIHSGYIRCEVDNSAGANVYSKVCYLLVKPKPKKPILDQTGNLLSSDVACQTYLYFYNGVWKGQYNTKIIKPTEEGDYTLRVICDGCASELSDAYYYRLINSVVNANMANLDMYPNPTQGMVILDLPGIHAENPATISIFDLSGKVIKTIRQVNSDNYELDLSNLSKGMYVVHVNSAEVSFSGKLIKN